MDLVVEHADYSATDLLFFFALFLLLTTQRIKKTAINLLFHQGGYYKRMVKSTINQLTVVSLPWSHEGRLWVFQNKSIQFPKHPKKKKSWASKNGMVPMLTMFLKIAPSLYIYIYTYWVRYYYPGKLFMQKCQGNQQKDQRRQHKKKKTKKNIRTLNWLSRFPRIYYTEDHSLSTSRLWTANLAKIFSNDK